MKKVLLIIGVVVLVLGVGALSFYLGSKYDWFELNESSYSSNSDSSDKKKEKDINENKENDEKKDEYKNLSLKDELVLEASKFVTKDLCYGASYSYDGKSRKISDLSANYKMNTIIAIYFDDILETIANGSKITIKKSSLERYFDDLTFLDSFKDVDSGSTKDYRLDYPMHVEYKNDTLYISGYATGCELPESNNYTKLLSAKRNDNNLVLTFHYSFLKIEGDVEDFDNIKYSAYKKYGDKTPVLKGVIMDDNGDFKLDYDKFDKYEYVFDISDNKLVLKEINYVKED